MRRKKVFVSGCFDMLHSGHIRFLEKAAELGDVFVALGSDRTLQELKGRAPVTTEVERQYMLGAVRYVKKCIISRGSGLMDFAEELKRVRPDVFIVNEDGNTPAKAELCQRLGIQYLVMKRDARDSLPARSTTSLRRDCRIPYRMDLAGGWLDQPFVSKHGAGPVLTLCIEPTLEFNERSGMASSTRRRAIELWQTEVPHCDREKCARLLFSYENPPGTTLFSGSQDSIGIVFPGLTRLDYRGGYWPENVTSAADDSVLSWLESHLYLVPLGPRKPKFDVFRGKQITPAGVRALAIAADQCWQTVLEKNLQEFGRSVRASFEAQIGLFPAMVNAPVRTTIRRFADQALGWKLSGAGGGGYLILVSERQIGGAIQIKIRRVDD